MEAISHLVDQQKKYFVTDATRPVSFRLDQLKKLRSILLANERLIFTALKADLGKSDFEAYATELGIVLEEISRHIAKLKKWTKPKRVGSPLAAFPAASYLQAEPYGNVLIIAPWNYPFQLAVAPLIGAISAGNCAIIKPSEFSQHTSVLLEQLINSNFEKQYIHVVNGDASVSQALLNEAFDMIFFTGSPRVGKIVMKAAAEHLTPVVLELGGKSPCIVDKDTALELTARRIIWGKLINAGQTCIAPDYVLLPEHHLDAFIQHCIHAINAMYGDDPASSADYPRMISEANVVRMQQLIQGGTIVYGGLTDRKQRYVSPTLVIHPDLSAALMQEEIFGPVLPILTYSNLDEAIDFVRSRPKPLALYVFSKNRRNQNRIVSSISAGGVTVNDSIMHFTNANLPFGGVGNSGMGAYHGKASFLAFSHNKSVMKRASWLDVPLRYPPFGNKLQLVKKVLK